jgi:hypothetical protein
MHCRCAAPSSSPPIGAASRAKPIAARSPAGSVTPRAITPRSPDTGRFPRSGSIWSMDLTALFGHPREACGRDQEGRRDREIAARPGLRARSRRARIAALWPFSEKPPRSDSAVSPAWHRWPVERSCPFKRVSTESAAAHYECSSSVGGRGNRRNAVTIRLKSFMFSREYSSMKSKALP